MSLANSAFGSDFHRGEFNRGELNRADSHRADGPRAVEPPRVAPAASSGAPSAAAKRLPIGVRDVPEDWFVDPIHLGVPGVRTPEPATEASPRYTPAIRGIDRPSLAEPADDDSLAWQTDSLCAQTDPEAFFPEKGGSTRDAKKICGSCEVRAQCLEYALQNDERFGIWGGLSERERRKLRKRA